MVSASFLVVFWRPEGEYRSQQPVNKPEARTCSDDSHVKQRLRQHSKRSIRIQRGCDVCTSASAWLATPLQRLALLRNQLVPLIQLVLQSLAGILELLVLFFQFLVFLPKPRALRIGTMQI
jgi:hypothetical protein